MADPNQIPPLRGTQFESSDIGSLKSSVNLFRGDVNYQKVLVSLPGKPNDGTLAVQLSMRSYSNVQQEIARWNLDAPSSVLGVGWTLPLERISANSNGALSSACLAYAYDDGGSSNALVPSNVQWVRADLDPSLASGLPTVSAALIQAFGVAGLRLSASATVTGTGPWTLDDSVNEHVYGLTLTPSALQVADGGVPFDLQDYQFWKVFYYPAYERWEITDDTGAVKVFGGGVRTTDKLFQTSDGNSVEWGVKWGGATGNWAGSSLATDGQFQYAVGWNLSAKVDRWGDRIAYAYNGGPEFARNAQGLLQDVEQPVGAGLPYTKACYLTGVTDAFGRTIRLDYQPKTYSALIQEYMDPHKVLEIGDAGKPPTNLMAANAYQDRYETMYLNRVRVHAAGGEPLYRLDFDYDEPCDVSNPSAPNPGLCKRYLRGVTEYNAEGRCLPGYGFDYYWTAADGPNVGALRNITFPQGGVGEFTYSKAAIGCDRSLEIKAPTLITQGGPAVPRVWFGGDSAIVVWTSNDGTQATLEVYTWVGHWKPWAPEQPLYNGDGTWLIDFDVVANAVSFAVALTTSSQTMLYLFSADPQVSGEWHAAPQPVTFASTSVSLVAGDAFVLATIIDSSSGNTLYSLYRYQFDWRTDSWLGGEQALFGPTQSELFTLASAEYYVYLELHAATSPGAPTGTLHLNHLDPVTGFNERDDDTCLVYFNLASNAPETMCWAAGPALVAGSVATSDGTKGVGHYSVQIVQWGTDYQFLAIPQNLFPGLPQPPLNSRLTWPPTPTVVDANTVATGPDIFRFTGTAWVQGNLVPPVTSSTWTAFAYGADVALQTVNDGVHAPLTSLLAYDANSPNGFGKAATIPCSASGALYGYPSASGEGYVIAVNAVFYRGPDTSWSGISTQQPVFTLPTGINSLSLINQSPAFFSYLVPGALEVQIQLLQNGGVNAAAPRGFEDSLYFTTVYANGQHNSQDPNGQYPAGPSVFATYPASFGQFSDAQTFTLHRYAGNDIEGRLVDYPVQSLQVSDGYGQTFATAYELDPASAGSDPNGNVIKYYKAATYDGCAVPDQSAAGRTVTLYHNGFQPYAGASMLDGQLAQTVQFEGAALFSAPLSDAGLTDSDQPVSPSAKLKTLFTSAGVTLSGEATVQFTTIDGQYRYWLVQDPSNGGAYNIDRCGDRVRGFTGQAVASSSSVWQLYTQRSGGIAPGADPIPLHGGYPRTTQLIKTQDGVALTSIFQYQPDHLPAPLTGGCTRRLWSYFDAAGALLACTQENGYAAHAYPQLLAANVLQPVASTRTRVNRDANGEVTLSAAGTTFAPFMAPGNVSVFDAACDYAWVGDPSGADEGTFHGVDADPLLWRARSRIVARTPAGVVVESVDAGGLAHSTQLDTTGQVAILIASGASAIGQEVAYCGFEADEDVSAWTLAGGAAIATGDAHTGRQSLHLAPGATATRTLSPAAIDRRYVFSCWYKLPVGASTSGAGFTLTVQRGAAPVGQSITAPFGEATGRWTYAIASVDLPAYATNGGALSITLTGSAGSASDVLVDDVQLSPLDAVATFQVHDPVSRLATARLEPSGKTWRVVYDAFWCAIGRTDPGEAAKGLRLDYYSLQGNPQGFDGGDPNAHTKVQALIGGTVQTFLNGTEWQSQWIPDVPSSFATSSGALVHASAAQSNTLTCAEGKLTGDYAVYVQLAPPAAGQPLSLQDAFSLVAGTASVTRSPSDGQWTLDLGAGAPIASFGPVSGIPSGLLLVVTGPNLLFYADGQLLFSTAATVNGPPRIVTGCNALAFRNLALLLRPALRTTLQDATGVGRQEHMLGGAEYLVKQVVRNALAQRVVETKPVPGLFGGGAGVAPMRYRATLVDVPAFVANLGGSGLMTGDAADYYDGANGASADQGYPYSRALHEASPLARMVELGLPGLTSAIVLTNPPAERATVKRIYGNNAGAPLPPPLQQLPAAAFRVVTELNQLATPTVTLFDAAGQSAARYTMTGGGPAIGTTTARFDVSGVYTSVVLPNAYQYPAAKQQRLERHHNALGQLLYEINPDGGGVRYLYDEAGRVRFMRDAAQATTGTLTYFIYDLLGRERVRGTATWDWTDANDSVLAGYANARLWPEDSGVPHQRMRARTFDGDGSDPHALGHLVSATTFNGGVATVTEAWSWNEGGRVASHETMTSYPDGTCEGPFEVGYHYGHTGDVVEVEYPLGAATGLSAVRYRHDGLGRLVSAWDQADTLLGSFEYDALGHVCQAVLGENVVQESLAHDSLGRLAQQRDAAAQGGFGADLTYQADGSIQGQTERVQNGSEDTYSVTYAYDPSGQILDAANAGQPPWSWGCGFTDGDGTADQNGNIQSVQLGAAPDSSRYVYEPGQNRLQQVQWAGGGETNFAYHPDGTIASRTSTGGALADLSLTYAEGTSLTASVTVADETAVQLVYDSDGNRVGKRVTQGGELQSSTASVRGPLLPIVQADSAGDTSAFVFGPRGLILLVRGGTRYPVAIDHLGSTRMVFDPSGAIAGAYEYLPFGQIAKAREPSPGFMPLLFTGQELDAETGLYNFNARLYDGALGRFYGADPVVQFPSGYLYAANNPLILTDPTGMIVTRGDRIGLAIGMGALFVLGIGVGFLAPGALAAGMAAEAVIQNLVASAVVGAVSSAMTGAAYTGLSYDAGHNSATWSWSQFGKLVAIGAGAGGAGGAVSGIIGTAAGEAAGAAAGAEDVAASSEADASAATEAAGQEAKVKSTAQKAWESPYTKSFLRKVPGNVAGNLVATSLKTPLSNMVTRTTTTPLGMIEAYVETIGTAAGTAALPVAGSALEDKVQISAKLKAGWTYTSGVDWGSVVSTAASTAAAGAGSLVGRAAGAFYAPNSVIGND